ncbi:carbohydrate ABC transporter permease [Leifsonia sp. A12D58]|uniref:carbohydrate ABC transporter permease n=1 Tax=Leifsonia sp. A12D58 TaxID=3397674 RepID=UPI0039DFE1D8
MARKAQHARGSLKNGLMFTGPFLAIYAIFIIYPVLQAIFMSGFDWDLLGYTREWIGLGNYERMLWGTSMTWSLGHMFLWRVAILAVVGWLLVRPIRERRISVSRIVAVAGAVLLAIVLGFHPGEGGIWNDPSFWVAFRNTLLFTVVSTPIIAGLGLLMALALQGGRRGAGLYQMAFFLPYVLPVSVATLIWSYFLSPDKGLLAPFLANFGIAPIAWLSDPSFAMAGIIITTVWWTVGFNLVLFAAGLQDIDKTLYEAASLDGAGAWKKFVNITIPGLKHVLILVVITQVIASFQVFGQVNIMTSGGPGGATRVLIQHIYEAGFRDLELGYASTVSIFLFVVMLVVSVIQFKTIGRER